LSFLKQIKKQFDDKSNYVKWTPDIGTAYGGANGDAFSSDPDYSADSDASISGQIEAVVEQAVGAVVGQVVAVWTWPRSGLEKVMTQYRTLTSYEKMPGTATKGYSDALVQSGGADRVALINWMSR